jgi:hypothetical protein
MLSQNWLLYTISTVIMAGMRRNDAVLYTPRVRSFSVRMWRSISGTCSSFATVLSSMPMSIIAARMGSNSLSTSPSCKRKPRIRYILCTLPMAFTMLVIFRFFNTLTVPNLMCREIVTRNGTRLTYIMVSMHSVTSRYFSVIPRGIACCPGRTRGLACRVVFPLRDPRLGPKMSSAATTSSRVIRQCVSRLFSTTFKKSSGMADRSYLAPS